MIHVKNLPSLARLHLLLALAAAASLFLPWGKTLEYRMSDTVFETVMGWSYPGAVLLLLLLALGLVVSFLERGYSRRAGCAHATLLVANLLTGLGITVFPFSRGNSFIPLWGFMTGFFLFTLFHAVSLMLQPRDSERL